MSSLRGEAYRRSAFPCFKMQDKVIAVTIPVFKLFNMHIALFAYMSVPQGILSAYGIHLIERSGDIFLRNADERFLGLARNDSLKAIC